MNTQIGNELDAINYMLAAIGEHPVSTVDTNGISEASLAYNVLTQVTREVLTVGFTCNTENDYPFAPDIDGNITLPPSLLRFTGTTDLVKRGGKLYDRVNHTSTFTNTQKLTAIWMLPFDEIDEHIKNYIAARAALRFITQVLGSDTLVSLNGPSEEQARAAMNSAEWTIRPVTIFDSSDMQSAKRKGPNVG